MSTQANHNLAIKRSYAAMECEDACDLRCAHDGEPVSQNWPAVQRLRRSTEEQARGECQHWPGPLFHRQVRFHTEEVRGRGPAHSHHRDFGTFKRIMSGPHHPWNLTKVLSEVTRVGNKRQLMSMVDITDGHTELSDGRQGPGDLPGHCVMLQFRGSGLPASLRVNKADRRLLSAAVSMGPGSLVHKSDGCPDAGASSGKRQGWPQTALCASSCLPHGRLDSCREVSRTQPA